MTPSLHPTPPASPPRHGTHLLFFFMGFFLLLLSLILFASSYIFTTLDSSENQTDFIPISQSETKGERVTLNKVGTWKLYAQPAHERTSEVFCTINDFNNKKINIIYEGGLHVEGKYRRFAHFSIDTQGQYAVQCNAPSDFKGDIFLAHATNTSSPPPYSTTQYILPRFSYLTTSLGILLIVLGALKIRSRKHLDRSNQLPQTPINASKRLKNMPLPPPATPLPPQNLPPHFQPAPINKPKPLSKKLYFLSGALFITAILLCGFSLPLFFSTLSAEDFTYESIELGEKNYRKLEADSIYRLSSTELLTPDEDPEIPECTVTYPDGKIVTPEKSSKEPIISGFAPDLLFTTTEAGEYIITCHTSPTFTGNILLGKVLNGGLIAARFISGIALLFIGVTLLCISAIVFFYTLLQRNPSPFNKLIRTRGLPPLPS